MKKSEGSKWPPKATYAQARAFCYRLETLVNDVLQNVAIFQVLSPLSRVDMGWCVSYGFSTCKHIAGADHITGGDRIVVSDHAIAKRTTSAIGLYIVKSVLLDAFATRESVAISSARTAKPKTSKRPTASTSRTRACS